MFAGIFVAVAVIALALLFRWLFKWHDPDWDTEAKQKRAFLWSTRGSSGGFGA